MNAQETTEPLVIFPWTHIQISQEINTSDKSTIPSLCKGDKGIKITYSTGTEDRKYLSGCFDINRGRH